jgi:hypothetical protein
LPFQLLDPLPRRVQLPLLAHDQFDQSLDRDLSRANIVLELLNIHATLIADFPKSGIVSFQRMDGYVSAAVRQIAEKGEERLSRRYQYLVDKGKAPQKAVMAVARELAGFVWAIAQEVALKAA